MPAAAAKARLKTADDLAERGLRNAKLSRGAREALLLGNDNEGGQIGHLLTAHL